MKELEKLKKENKALRQLLEWAIECHFGFDVFEGDEFLEEHFNFDEVEDMNYIDALIYFSERWMEYNGRD